MASLDIRPHSPNLAAVSAAQPDEVHHLRSKGRKRLYTALNVIGVIGMAIAFPITLTVAAVFKVYTHHKIGETIQKLAIRRFTVLQQALINVGNLLTEEVGNSESSVRKAFLLELQELHQMLVEHEKGVPDPEDAHAHMQKVREKIDKILGMDYYKNNKKNKDDSLIRYIHVAAHTLTARAPGLAEMEAFGAKFTLDDASESIAGLAQTLDHAVYNYYGFQKDNLIGMIFWLIIHPQKTWASYRGHTAPLDYNSYKHGNANVELATYKVTNKQGQVMTMHHYFGPTPTADRLFEAHLQHLENEGKGAVHFQHDLEFAGTKGEDERRLEKKDMADEHDNLTYMATPLDGEIWKGTGNFADVKTAEAFHDQLSVYVIGQSMREMPEEDDNSFYIPEILTYKDVNDVVNTSKAAFKRAENSSYWQELAKAGPDGTKRLNKVQLLGFEAMLAVKMILNTAEDAKKDIEAFMGQACKQDIDRGVIINVMTLLYMDSLADIEINQDRIDQVVGIVLVRAGMVDDRAILRDRYEALSDFLHILESDPEAFMAEMEKLNSFDLKVDVWTES